MSKKHPNKCPGCGAKGAMVKASQQRTRFNVSKTVVGACIAGPLGLAIGACIGNTKTTYRCMDCGFEKEPDTLL